MSNLKKKFRKRPVIIEAEQFFADVEPWPVGVVDDGYGCACIPTLEGTMRVSDKDWVITGVQGEQYACKPDIFEMTYQRVEE